MSSPFDPATATRAEVLDVYVNGLGAGPHPPDAHPKWLRLLDAAIALFKALGTDESMAQNNRQTFNTPAANKNSQYFAWDFTMRTCSYIARSDPSLTSTSAMQRGEWVDALSRSSLIASVLLDERPGYLSQMVEATYPGFNPGGQPPMSDEITDAAEDLQRAAREGAAEFDWVPDVPNAIGL